MKYTKLPKFLKFFCVVAIIFAICALCFGKRILLHMDTALSKETRAEILSGNYNSIVLQMKDSSVRPTEYYNSYFGVSSFLVSDSLKYADSVSGYLAKLTNEYCFDTVFITLSCRQSADSLIPYLVATPSTDYIISYEIQPLSFWQKLSSKKIDESLSNIKSFVEKTQSLSNVRITWIGFSDWLIANPDCFESKKLSEHISRYVFLNELTTLDYDVSPENLSEKCNRFKELVTAKKTTFNKEYSLEEYSAFFFGDSVFDNMNIEELSIPHIVSQKTGLNTVNLAVGGSSASGTNDTPGGFERTLSAMQDVEFLPNGEKSIFIVEYGFNDFFSARMLSNPEDRFDTTTYSGALLSGINKLKEHYPEAQILLIAPYYLSPNAYAVTSTEVSGRPKLAEYIASAEAVASAAGIPILNLYELSGINEENYGFYLKADEVHPSEEGCILLAEIISKKLAEIIQ